MEQPCSSLVLLLSWGEQIVPSQLLCCSSRLSCLISDASLAPPVQWLLLWFCVWAESCESVETMRNGSRVWRWRRVVRGVRSGRMRSSAERWACWPEESVDDRRVGRGHRRRVWHLTLLLGCMHTTTVDLRGACCRRTIFLPTICFVLLFLSSFFSVSRLCQCKLLLASPFLLFFFFFATRTWRLYWRGRV